MKPGKSILRIFEVRAKAGKARQLKRKLSGTSVPLVAGAPGNRGYLFGETVPSDGNDLVFISIWEDLESIQSLFGKDWEKSYLPEGYAELIESCSIKHVEFEGELNLLP